jgi:thiamine pyrophosphate-dependent acetolactate synthase large subunit-like protein
MHAYARRLRPRAPRGEAAQVEGHAQQHAQAVQRLGGARRPRLLLGTAGVARRAQRLRRVEGRGVAARPRPGR